MTVGVEQKPRCLHPNRRDVRAQVLRENESGSKKGTLLDFVAKWAVWGTRKADRGLRGGEPCFLCSDALRSLDFQLKTGFAPR